VILRCRAHYKPEHTNQRNIVGAPSTQTSLHRISQPKEYKWSARASRSLTSAGEIQPSKQRRRSRRMANVEYVWNQDFTLCGEFSNLSPSSRSSSRRRFGTSRSSMRLTALEAHAQSEAQQPVPKNEKTSLAEKTTLAKLISRKFSATGGSRKKPEQAESSVHTSTSSKDIAQRLWNR